MLAADEDIHIFHASADVRVKFKSEAPTDEKGSKVAV
jgi:hypothetical protein